MNIYNDSYVDLGPNRLTFIFSPRPGATLSNWTLPTEPVQSIEWNGNSVYVLHICRGLIPNDYEITLTFKVSTLYILIFFFNINMDILSFRYRMSRGMENL